MEGEKSLDFILKIFQIYSKAKVSPILDKTCHYGLSLHHYIPGIVFLVYDKIGTRLLKKAYDCMKLDMMKRIMFMKALKFVIKRM